MNSSGQVEVTVLRDKVQERIRNAIWNGRLKPGDRIVEMQLARELGVSQAPVREALRELEQKGLVVARPRRGTFVTTPSPKSIRELYSLRLALEQFAARLVVPRFGETGRAELEAIVAQMRQADAPEPVVRLVRLDQMFHERFVALADHALLFRTWANLHPVQWTYITIAESLSYDPELVARSHQQLVDAFQTRDVGVAERQLEAHIMRSLGDVLARFGDE